MILKRGEYPFLTLIWKDKVFTDVSYKKISTKTEEQSGLRFRCLQNPFSKVFRQNRLYFCWCNFRRVTRGVGLGETSPPKSVFLIYSCAHSTHFHSHHPRPSRNKIQAKLQRNFYSWNRELLVACSRNYICFINCLIGGGGEISKSIFFNSNVFYLSHHLLSYINIWKRNHHCNTQH